MHKSLFAAAQNALRAIGSGNDFDLSRMIEQKTVDPNGHPETRLLHHAVERRQLGAVKILLAAKADANLMEQGGDRTPLMLAAENGQPDLVEALLPFSDVNRVDDKDGWSAAFHAVASKQPNALGCLRKLAAAADLTLADRLGRNVLHVAAQHGNPRAVAFLSEIMDERQPDRQGTNALAHAAFGVAFCKKSAASVEALSFLAARATRDCANNQDDSGRNALMMLIDLDAPELADLLLPLADLSLTDKRGRSALTTALDRTRITWREKQPHWDLAERLAGLVDDQDVARAAAFGLDAGNTPKLFARAEALALSAEIAPAAHNGESGAAGDEAARRGPSPARRI